MTAEEATWYSLAAVFGLGMIVAFCILCIAPRFCPRAMGGEQSWCGGNDELYMDGESAGDIEMMDVQQVSPGDPAAAQVPAPATRVPSVAGMLPGAPMDMRPLPPPPSYDEWSKDTDEGPSAASPPMRRDDDDFAKI